MSIRIIEIFVKMREILTDNLSVRLDMEEIKKKLENHNKIIALVFSYPLMARECFTCLKYNNLQINKLRLVQFCQPDYVLFKV